MRTRGIATTSDTDQREPGVPACDLMSIPASDRASHLGLARSLLFSEGHIVTDIADGLAFELPAARFVDVARFVENERRCCAHLRFVIEVRPASAPVILKVTGPGVREALAAIAAPPST